MASEPYIYKEADWVPQNSIGIANRSNVYTPIVYYESGGRLFTDERRFKSGQQNKTEYNKYKKEQQMAKVMANAGYEVEHLAETPRTPTADARVNGELVDFKRLSSTNNIRRHANYATKKQGAKKVVFQFEEFNRNYRWELQKLARKGVHGYYFVTNDTRVRTF